MDLTSDFKEFIGLLNENGVKHLIIGGYAVALHGHPRYTKDLDFWIWAEPENAARLLKSLTDFGFASLDLTIADFLAPDQVVQLGYPPNRIDLLTSLTGLDFQTCYERCGEVSFEEMPIRYIGLDDLIVAKTNAGRPQDKVDIKKLIKGRLKK